MCLSYHINHIVSSDHAMPVGIRSTYIHMYNTDTHLPRYAHCFPTRHGKQLVGHIHSPQNSHKRTYRKLDFVKMNILFSHFTINPQDTPRPYHTLTTTPLHRREQSVFQLHHLHDMFVPQYRPFLSASPPLKWVYTP